MEPEFLNAAKTVWPGLSDGDLSIVLWSLTTFPMGLQNQVLQDLKSAYDISGGDFLQALYMADEQRVAQMLKRG